MRRHELSDAEWEFVRPLLPESLRGRKRLDDRRVLNGIVWKFRTGTAWRDVPERYGPWATLHTRFRRWAADGTFDRMLRAAQAGADAAGDVEWLVSVDSTIVRAHQHAAGARKGGILDPALGRSRGGLTSKIHLACDGRGRPLAFVVTGGNTNDCTRFTAVMEAIRVPRLGPGRPRIRPDHVLGDKGYSSKAIRAWLRRHGIPHTIPERADQVRNRARRGSRGGRPPAFDREAYKHRNVVERCFNRLKQWRGIATRYDKTAQSYEAAVALASLLMWA
ncbi:IS5 family transposase (plasmid) [Streptomyces murinus]|uniref:IS5 family transposase n=1 Tax=Streptomyces murinus TaxID=33900 RepID=UPI002378A378|nr:IS5 family transposase [Streptomyces murinus]WDO10797.1 IS5 family transposase [Streptomyces murinus]WDO10962.1 IS5 family transposase [Streptomyces murinus]WDO10973.1 IS5 family transposase [Streptomyces murinus]WDO11005.1 IS5 family transposase [Streptomyces murinus]WDO11035.1 IS5 family transposase [Streptomyces murinus]